MKVSPIFDWTFSEIWQFLREIKLPYCSLYDKGYTRIDEKFNTRKNPHLKNLLTNNYSEAYKLENDSDEHASRFSIKIHYKSKFLSNLFINLIHLFLISYDSLH